MEESQFVKESLIRIYNRKTNLDSNFTLPNLEGNFVKYQIYFNVYIDYASK